MIGLNGIIGGLCILIVLFIFLNIKAGLWVALGLPFTFSATLVFLLLYGFSINNTTLAAIIIIMGVVVDDAIIVSENISRLRKQGLSWFDASLNGASQVFKPVLASVITTCVAFIPLFFFGGRWGRVNHFIPPVIIVMLIASLIESFCILPGHMAFSLSSYLGKYFSYFKNKGSDLKKDWFVKIENYYEKCLIYILPFRYCILIGIFLITCVTIFLFKKKGIFLTFFI